MTDPLTIPAPPPAPLAYAFARANGVLVDGGTARHRPGLSLAAILELQRLHGALAFEPQDDATFERLLAERYSHGAADAADVAAATGDLASLANDASQAADLLDSGDDAPVVRLINAILLQAIREGASDIHVETEERRLVVRFRVDGTLREVIEPARALAPLLVSRIKVMARLDIAEKRLPHDGRVALRIGGHDLDVRVSTLPAQHGERVVMRLLDRAGATPTPATLGMSAADVARFERMIARPHGVLLVTGPTGSGKTTTLYAALSQMNDRRRNIMTVEDPIEYAVDGVGQTQVNARTGLTFAHGLRAILRQDPDVIMVGEIRDHETAEVAIRAAMTGHFVLSTLHTNTAVGAVARLVDMGVERYLLSAVVVGLIAQRLVRRLCPDCRAPDHATAADAAVLGGVLAQGTPLFRARGCGACADGYRGRVALYEIVEADAAITALIHDGASEAELTAAARAKGLALVADGAAKVAAGVTTVEEVARVGGEGT